MDATAPPPGFSLDSDDDVSQTFGAAPVPKGFKLDQDDSPPAAAPDKPSVFGTALRAVASPVTNALETARAVGESGLTSITGGAASLADTLTGEDPGSHSSWVYQPRSDPGKSLSAAQAALGKAAGKEYDMVAGTGPLAQTVKERFPEALGAVGTVIPLLGTGVPLVTGAARTVRSGLSALDDWSNPNAAPVAPAPLTAEQTLAQQTSNAPANMGAAAAVPDISKASPILKQVIVQAGPNLPVDVLNRHLTVDTLPMPEGVTPAPLRKGQALQDPQQMSDEINLRADPDTQGLLSSSITAQDNTLGQSMGEIRRRATPDIVQRSTPENAQANIDAIKVQDNAAVLDMRAKYKALADANGGAMPFDASAAVPQIKAQLAKGFLTKTAANNPVISEVMDSLGSGEPIPFESFENARTNLAAVQRQGGSDAAAAGIVRNNLENMPLPPEAQHLKGLANVARASAKSRFDTIDQNPAYEAAVNDNVPKDQNGLHIIGAPSPLADGFMDRYYLGNGPNASRAYVQRMQGVMQNNPDFAQSIEAASLNKLRDAAGLDQYDSGPFRNAGYRNARAAMDNKADVLMSPQSVDYTDQLGQASSLYNDTGKASSVNRSNTAVTLQRFGALPDTDPSLWGHLADVGSDIGAHAALPVAGGTAFQVAKGVGKMVMRGRKDAATRAALQNSKLKFAQDATAPGAGLAPHAKAAGGSVGRASGGKVDHEALVEKLYQRWKSAKKDTNKSTKPLLGVPDAAIIKALTIAQEHI